MTKADIWQALQTKELSRVGVEGSVSLSGDIAIKEQRSLHGLDAPISLQLAERRRRAVHGFFNALYHGQAGTLESRQLHSLRTPKTESFTFLHVHQASSWGGQSIGVLSRVYGKESSAVSTHLYNAARSSGAQIDVFGRNNVIVVEKQGARCYCIVETIGGICLEGVLQLQALQRIGSTLFPRALYFFVQALAFDGVSGFPTCPWQEMEYAIECGFRRIRGDEGFEKIVRPSSFWSRVATTDRLETPIAGVLPEGSRGVFNTSLSKLYEAEIKRIEEMMKTCWSYQELDLKSFSNYREFGLDSDLVNIIEKKRKDLKTPMGHIILAHTPQVSSSNVLL